MVFLPVGDFIVNFLSTISIFAAEEGGSAIEKLGLSWEEVLFHAISLVVLVAFMWWLLYKPVKKIIKERQDKIKEVFENNQKLQQEASDAKVLYETMLAKAKEEAAAVAQEAIASANDKSKQVLVKAEMDAQSIVSVAHKETEIERTQMQNEFKEQSTDIIVTLASKIIEREINAQDHKKFVEEALKEWEGA